MVTPTSAASSSVMASFQYHQSWAANSPTTTTQTQSSPRDPAIRHAGRAHIRGKIRRVWRPRYLELCDTGLVRYYELPPTADVTLPEDSDWDHVNMIPKDTLLIYHARIIDVTTLRDLHVGLPKGSYGFLFRGQRQSSHLELLTTNSNEPNPPREYFCAVSTLEEAQTWVIVLQWAASVCKASYSSLHQRTNSSGSGLVDTPSASINFLGDSCHIPSGAKIPSLDHSGRYELNTTNSHTPISENTNGSAVMDSDSDADGANYGTAMMKNDAETSAASSIAIATSRSRSRSDTGDTRRTKSTTTGRIVVTKVHGCRIVRVPGGSTMLEWQVAYEIALLVLQVPKVEERRLLKTRRGLEQLLEDLLTELDSKIALTLVEDWRDKLSSQDLPCQILGNQTKTNNVIHRMINSYSFVDQMLRALAMDANIVNSKAMKGCFVLGSEAPPKLIPPRWWKAGPIPQTITFWRILTVSEDDTDSFVKAWLSSSSSSSPPSSLPSNTHARYRGQEQEASSTTTATFLWMLQRPWMVLGGAGMGLALSVPTARVYQQMMVSVTLRLDLLVGSWCLAAYLGNEYLGAKANGNPRRGGYRSKSLASSSRRQLVESSSSNSHITSQSNKLKSTIIVKTPLPENEDDIDASSVDSKDDLDYLVHDDEADAASVLVSKLSSPLPQYPHNNGESCWSVPPDHTIFRVRGPNYLEDRIKIPSGLSPFQCRGVDVWLTDNPERHIARHPSVLNGKLGEEDTFLVNFLLPFGNFVSYFTVPPLEEFPEKLADVWSKFVKGDQQYRDKRLKLLPVVMDGPWIVKAAVGNGTAPALLGKVIPLQYFFKEPHKDDSSSGKHKKGVYEVDVIITASSIAKGILSVVKGHTKSLTIAFAFIIEAAEQEELPETVLCAFQVHALHLEDCPHLPECNLDEI